MAVLDLEGGVSDPKAVFEHLVQLATAGMAILTLGNQNVSARVSPERPPVLGSMLVVVVGSAHPAFRGGEFPASRPIPGTKRPTRREYSVYSRPWARSR